MESKKLIIKSNIKYNDKKSETIEVETTTEEYSKYLKYHDKENRTTYIGIPGQEKFRPTTFLEWLAWEDKEKDGEI